jgi:hypothetical protein
MTKTGLLIMPKNCNSVPHFKEFKKLKDGQEDTKFRESYRTRKCITIIPRPHHFLFSSTGLIHPKIIHLITPNNITWKVTNYKIFVASKYLANPLNAQPGSNSVTKTKHVLSIFTDLKFYELFISLLN